LVIHRCSHPKFVNPNFVNPNLVNPAMTAFACIFVPDFPAAALLRSHPEWRSQQIGVVDGETPLQKVVAMNESARRAGIELGMTKSQVETLPGLTLCPRSLSEEADAHAALLDCAQSFSPRIEDAGLDTVIVDLRGLQSLFGSAASVASNLAARLRDLGLKANIAIASNPDTAVLAARGFSGVTIIPAGKEAERLSSLPVEILLDGGPDSNPEAEQFLETFHRWGVRTLGALAALPAASFSERLGQAGLHLQRLARGEIFRTLVPVEPPLVFEESIELEYPLTLLEPLAILLSQLLEKLFARLNAFAFATQQLRLRLELADDIREEETCSDSAGLRIFERTLRLPLPLRDYLTFLKLLQLDLQAHPPGAPILKIHLCAEPVKPRAAQSGLFAPPAPEPEKLELTLARIAGIVGEGHAGSVELLDSHRPESFRMRHFVPHESEGDETERKATASIMALRILRPPWRAKVAICNGQPARIAGWNENSQKEILWAAGPWRSAGDWWEQKGWARDEWDVAVQEDSCIAFYRLVRNLLSGEWFLEGTYD
jgi:protein ImuB